MLEDHAPRTNARAPHGKRLAPLPPLLAIEFAECRAGQMLLLGFSRPENMEEGLGGRIMGLGFWK
jgi:hypothetical protein